MMDLVVHLTVGIIFNIVLGFLTLFFAYFAWSSFDMKDWFEGVICIVITIICLLMWVLFNYMMYDSK